MSEWIDVTSYSRDGKDKTPQSWKTDLGKMSVVVTRHIYAPVDAWVLRCSPYFDMTVLKAKEINAAKDEALRRVHHELHKSLNAAIDAQKVTQRSESVTNPKES